MNRTEIPNFSFILFFAWFIIYFVFGWYLAIELDVYHNDAIARTALASFTVFGRDPHFASIGAVWTPLPSLIQIPFLMLFRPFGLTMLASPLMGALFGAASVVGIYHIGRLLSNNKITIVLPFVVVLYAINPLILLYSSLGMSEVVFITSIIYLTYFMMRWLESQSHGSLLLASVFLASSFWSRYESLPVFGAMIVILILFGLVKKYTLKKIESIVMLFAIPFLYSVGVWILFNWLIMKDPFYFLNSPFSNTSFTEILKKNPQDMEYSYHSILGSLVYGFKRIFYLSPIIFISFALLLYDGFVSWRSKYVKPELLKLSYLLVPFVSILFFHMYQLFKGDSFGWLRFFMYVIPAGSFFALYAIHRFNRTSVTLVILGFLIFSNSLSLLAMKDYSLGKEEVSFINKLNNTSLELDFSRTYADQRRIAQYMSSTSGTILIDTDQGFAVPLFSQEPERYVITSDTDYREVVQNFKKQVDWVIIPAPRAEDRGQNIIYSFYPSIWNGMKGLTLVKKIDDWKIYKVTRIK